MKLSEVMREGFNKYPQTQGEFVTNGENTCVCAVGAVYIACLPENLKTEFIERGYPTKPMWEYINDTLGFDMNYVTVPIPEEVREELLEKGYVWYARKNEVGIESLILGMNDTLGWDADRIIATLERMGY